MPKPEEITAKHHRTLAEIRRDHRWVEKHAEELKAVFGGYAGLKIIESGETVFSWEKKQKKRPVIKLSMKRRPHLWTDKEDLCLKK